MRGKIIKGIAGFYYVYPTEEAAGSAVIYECRARGIFRNEHVKPLVGDDVEMDISDKELRTGTIVRILQRRSELIRPAVANIDQALVIFSIVKPEPNFNLLDRFLIMMEQQGLHSIICFNKQDIAQEAQKEELRSIYGACGCKVLFVSARQNEGIEELRGLLAGRTTAVAGPSGAGKSSLINRLNPKADRPTGEISRKVERGKHTTRHTEIIALGKDTYIMDTPGFTSLQLFDMEKEELKEFYPEFSEYESGCRFAGCAHLDEPGCSVKEALLEGKISRVRYENYRELYGELRDRKRY